MSLRAYRRPLLALVIIIVVTTTGRTEANTVAPTKAADDTRSITADLPMVSPVGLRPSR